MYDLKRCQSSQDSLIMQGSKESARIENIVEPNNLPPYSDSSDKHESATHIIVSELSHKYLS
jgi:hypothetical protein